MKLNVLVCLDCKNEHAFCDFIKKKSMEFHVTKYILPKTMLHTEDNLSSVFAQTGASISAL